MKTYAKEINIIRPKNLDDALQLLSKQHSAPLIPFAGGTDIMVVLNKENNPYIGKTFIDLSTIKELRSFKFNKEKSILEINAMCTAGELKNNPSIQKNFPMLAEATNQVGAIAIQNRATIGGNIINASPAADTPPALMCYNAILTIRSKKKERKIALSDFYLGYKKLDLRSDELLTSITIYKPEKNTKEFFRKVGARKAMSISKIVLAIAATTSGKKSEKLINKINIAIGSVAASTLKCRKTEEYITNKKLTNETIAHAKEIFSNEISPIDDIRSTSQYRRKVSENLFENFLQTL